MKKITNIIGKQLYKLTTGVAMAAAFIAVVDRPCFFFLGEPQIPESLLELKRNKLGE